MSQRFVVKYTAPVFVHVEINDDGEVDVHSVSVGDEWIELDEGVGNGGVLTYPDFDHATDADRDLILTEIDEVEWPHWEFG